MFFLARRAVAASLLTFIARPDPLPAAAPPSCSRSALTTIRETLAQSEKLLPTRDKWPEAQSLLNGVDDAALQKNLDACVESKTFKDVAMDQSAFIVYYEERRYGDTRLEPQTPSLRAEQNGKKKELPPLAWELAVPFIIALPLGRRQAPRIPAPWGQARASRARAV